MDNDAYRVIVIITEYYYQFGVFVQLQHFFSCLCSLNTSPVMECVVCVCVCVTKAVA